MIFKQIVFQVIRVHLLAILLLAVTYNFAQQTFLSNYLLLDSYVNPAWAGSNRSDFKFLIATRQQWASFQQPLNTQLATLDYNLFRKTDYFTGGILFLNDQKSFGGFNTSSLQLNLAYHKSFGKHEFSMAFQPGYFSSSFSNQNTYPSQYDHSIGQYNTAIENNEASITGNINNFNLNAGIMYIGKFKAVEYGLGVSNFNMSKQSVTSYFQVMGVEQKQQISANGYLKIKLKDKLYTSISTIYQQERYTTLNQMIAGARIIYIAQRNTLQSLYAGTFVRHGINRNIDAYIFSAGFRLVNFDVSFSYDYNVSSLNQATGYYGATELVIQYFIQRKLPERKLIPCERI